MRRGRVLVGLSTSTVSASKYVRYLWYCQYDVDTRGIRLTGKGSAGITHFSSFFHLVPVPCSPMDTGFLLNNLPKPFFSFSGGETVRGGSTTGAVVSW